MGDGNSIAERAKVRCGVCNQEWESHSRDAACWVYRPRDEVVASRGEARTIGYLAPAGLHRANGPPTAAELGRNESIYCLLKLLRRLQNTKADFEAIPDRGREFDGAIEGIKLGCECVERNIQRLKGANRR